MLKDIKNRPFTHSSGPHLLNDLSEFVIIIPFLNFSEELKKELSYKKLNPLKIENNLFFFKQSKEYISLFQNLIWAQDIWLGCTQHPIDSVNQGIEILKRYKNIGCYYPLVKNNFGLSISKKVKNLELKRIKFKFLNEFNFKFTAWTMIDNQLIVSENPLKRFPFGWHEFNEDKSTPPNRAYLKLWELLTVYNIPIQKNDIAIEVGSSPGGWTWVLSQFMKKIYSIDRAPLAKEISKISNIQHQEGDAFKLNPENFKDATWFFSDLICTPEKIFETIQFWLSHSKIENFVCTIKFKGDCPIEYLDRFLSIEHSLIIHLYHNKNEVTWIRTPRLSKKSILIKTFEGQKNESN